MMTDDAQWFMIGMGTTGSIISIYRIICDLREGMQLLIFLIGVWILTYSVIDYYDIGVPKEVK